MVVGVIHNPYAKRNKKHPEFCRNLESIFSDVGFFRKTTSKEMLPEIASDFLKEGVDTLIINGGDGSLHLTLSAFIGVYGDRPLPRVMSLRGGTMNTATNSLKMKGSTLSLARKAVACIRNGGGFRTKDQHLIKVNEKYGFMTGIGTVTRFLDTYYSSSDAGPIEASKMVCKMIAGAIVQSSYIKNMFASTSMNITIEGETVKNKSFAFMLACTIRELGLGFAPTPRAYEKPGHFHLLVASMKPLTLVSKVPALWLGRDIEHSTICCNRPVSEAVIEPLGKMRWMIDGELYDTEEPLHFSVGPTIQIIAP